MAKHLRTSGAPRGHRLTSLDSAVLMRIAKVGFQTHGELRKALLGEFTREHSWRAMKKLVEMNYLVEIRGDGDEMRGWSLGKKATRELSEFQDKAGWAVGSHAPTYRTSFRHDVILREMQSLIETSPAVTTWIPEQKLRKELMALFHYLHARDQGEKMAGLPDALIHLRSAGKDSKAALELELTQKSKRRLFRKFENHMTNPDYDFVFYIVEGRRLLESLWSVYADVRENSGPVKIASRPNGIYFVELDVIRRLGLAAKFTSAEDSFSFRDLV